MKNHKWKLPKPDDLLLDFLEENKILGISLLNEFRNVIKEKGQVLYHQTDRHWNQLGIDHALKVSLPIVLNLLNDSTERIGEPIKGR